MKGFWSVLLLLLGIRYSMAQCPNIIWEDNFEGTSLDIAKWNIQLGDGCNLGNCGWGNNELQFYQAENIAVNQGNLQIIAKKESVGNKSYTSARITTKQKGDWTYGRFEARMKLPTGKGIWPAFWMLSTPEPYGSWPQSGEIDIMELIGSEPSTTHGTIHFGQLVPANRSVTASYTLREGIFNDEFHTFALEWGVNIIRWYIDGFLYATQTNLATGGSRWPFDHDFHLILNLAVGGNWPGSPNSSTEFPQILEVDYVRVYDGFLPSITGERFVENQAKSVRYQLFNLPPEAQVNWTVPEGATLVSGQGESSILVDWNSIGGIVQANFTNGCQVDSLRVAVTVAPAFVSENTWENFDDPGKIVFIFSTGLLDDNTTNPGPDDVNSSPLCGKYVRNVAEQFDVLVYDVDQLDDAGPYLEGEKRFYLDVYTDAPVGTIILLQLENNNRSQPTNYPVGRNSRYEARTKVQGAWQRLHLTFLDRPDPNTLNTSIDQVILLFGSNTNLGSTFFFDNLETYAPEQTVGVLVPDQKLIKVYPNPADEYLILDLEPHSNIRDIKIYHFNGSLQEQIAIAGDKSNQLVNISKLNKGVYLISIISTDGRQQIARFIKI